MNLIQRVSALVMMLSTMCVSASGAIVVSSEPQEFVGPGAYSFDILATAEGQNEEIGGFNLRVDFSDPAFTFQSVSYNAAFETLFPPPAVGATLLELQAADNNFVGLQIANGASATIATINFDATGPGQAQLLNPDFSTTFFQPIASSIDPVRGNIGFPTAIPEPSSLVFLAVLGSIAVARRSRRDH